jgi:hypothetical protein
MRLASARGKELCAGREAATDRNAAFAESAASESGAEHSIRYRHWSKRELDACATRLR